MHHKRPRLAASPSYRGLSTRSRTSSAITTSLRRSLRVNYGTGCSGWFDRCMYPPRIQFTLSERTWIRVVGRAFPGRGEGQGVLHHPGPMSKAAHVHPRPCSLPRALRVSKGHRGTAWNIILYPVPLLGCLQNLRPLASCLSAPPEVERSRSQSNKTLRMEVDAGLFIALAVPCSTS